MGKSMERSHSSSLIESFIRGYIRPSRCRMNSRRSRYRFDDSPPTPTATPTLLPPPPTVTPSSDLDHSTQSTSSSSSSSSILPSLSDSTSFINTASPDPGLDGATLNSPSPTTSVAQQGGQQSGSNNASGNTASHSTPPGVIVGAVLGSLAVVIISVAIFVFCRHRRQRSQVIAPPSNNQGILPGGIPPHHYSDYLSNTVTNSFTKPTHGQLPTLTHTPLSAQHAPVAGGYPAANPFNQPTYGQPSVLLHGSTSTPTQFTTSDTHTVSDTSSPDSFDPYRAYGHHLVANHGQSQRGWSIATDSKRAPLETIEPPPAYQ
jgi:hypothetical protein